MARTVALLALLAGAALAASSVPAPSPSQSQDSGADEIISVGHGIIASSVVGSDPAAMTMVAKCDPNSKEKCPLPSPVTMVYGSATLHTSFETPIVEDGQNLGNAKADLNCKIQSEEGSAKCDIDVKGEKDGKVFYTYHGQKTVSKAQDLLGIVVETGSLLNPDFPSESAGSMPSSTGTGATLPTPTATGSTTLKTSASQTSSDASASPNAATGSTTSTTSTASPSPTSGAGSIASHNIALAGVVAVVGYVVM